MTGQILAHVAHISFGGLTAIFALIHPVISIINTISFIAYEIEQSRHKKDPAYEEILEFLIGLTIGELIIILKALSRFLVFSFP